MKETTIYSTAARRDSFLPVFQLCSTPNVAEKKIKPHIQYIFDACWSALHFCSWKFHSLPVASLDFCMVNPPRFLVITGKLLSAPHSHASPAQRNGLSGNDREAPALHVPTWWLLSKWVTGLLSHNWTNPTYTTDEWGYFVTSEGCVASDTLPTPGFHGRTSWAPWTIREMVDSSGKIKGTYTVTGWWF